MLDNLFDARYVQLTAMVSMKNIKYQCDTILDASSIPKVRFPRFTFWQMYSNFKETNINCPEALSFNLEENKAR